MDKSSLLKVHQNKLKVRHNNEEHMQEIVQALGGIDRILTDYLRHSDMILTEESMKEIHRIITTDPKQKITFTNDNIELNGGAIFCMESNNNYLFALFGETQYNSILTFIHNKLTQILMILTWIFWFVFVALRNELLWSLYIIVTSLLLLIPYCLFWVLSVNKKAFRKILKTFDFWIKLSYLFVWGVFELIHRFILQRDTFQRPILSLAAYLLFDIVCFLGLVIISSFDGFETKKNYRIVISAFVACITLLYSVWYQLDRISNGDDSIVVIFDYQFSLRAIMGNAQRVIGIFLAKQAFNLIKNRQKATSINIKPFLVWGNAPQSSSTYLGIQKQQIQTPQSKIEVDIKRESIEDSIEMINTRNVKTISFNEREQNASDVSIVENNNT